MKKPIAPLLIYTVAFIVGAVLMGFEMLGSRYLFPWFGGGIGAWAGLIEGEGYRSTRTPPAK